MKQEYVNTVLFKSLFLFIFVFLWMPLTTCSTSSQNLRPQKKGDFGAYIIAHYQSDQCTNETPLKTCPLFENYLKAIRYQYFSDISEQSYMTSIAVHSQIEAAIAQAEKNLLHKLWGPQSEIPKHAKLPKILRPVEDIFQRAILADGQYAVILGIEREVFAERIEDWLDELAQTLPEENQNNPQSHIPVALQHLKFHSLEVFGCERREVIAQVECMPPAIAELPTIAYLAERVSLLPAIQGGIPQKNKQIPWQPVSVNVYWQQNDGHELPWTGVKVKFTSNQPGVLESSEARTNHLGFASVGFSNPPEANIRIQARIDENDLFVGLSNLNTWQSPSTTIQLRLINQESLRIAVYFFERLSKKATFDQVTTNTTAAGLRALGYSQALMIIHKYSFPDFTNNI